MAKCSFCKEEIRACTGMIFVKRDGSILSFCSNKCRKNRLKLKRNPRKLKWVGKGI
ncbi:MAG: 50S ribosomal protein L24e [Candidatus ainarchaeum sp.]|nr:50S ribosomal protein L24e [Candidatus ainarchaeum sp.]